MPDGGRLLPKPWSPEHASAVEAAFREFLNQCWVKSKENDWIILGQNLYGGQEIVITKIFEGLGRDKHTFKVLKSRQLGISTIVRALMLFWSGAFHLNGALVFHEATKTEEGRVELLDILSRMGPEFRFPRVTRSNRALIILENMSRISMLTAGTKKTSSTRHLGASLAVSLAHRSELCSYGDKAGLESMRHSFARTNPNRLFVDESTARGRNLWWDIWNEAKADEDAICIFIGWWSHPDQVISRSDPQFERYTRYGLTDEEKRKIKEVQRLYGHEITLEQLAWIRKEMDPSAGEDDADRDYSADPLRIQEQPWTEDDAWQMQGATFFDPQTLNNQARTWASQKYTPYMFMAGFEFIDLKCIRSPSPRTIQLKVWEPPVEDSVYIIGCDPAYGINENNDRSCVQVLRAFSDGIDQVAEYAWPLIDSQQLAWVMAALEAWYAGQSSRIYRILELNGPGASTYKELQSLKSKLQLDYYGKQDSEGGLLSVQRTVRDYFYHRADALAPGHALHFRTEQMLKIQIMERLRDFVNSGTLRIRSFETLNEMQDVVREGDSIGAEGSDHDDRVMALALACRQWEDAARRPLMASKRTREGEQARRRMNRVDMAQAYNASQLSAFLAKQRGSRLGIERAMIARAWGRR